MHYFSVTEARDREGLRLVLTPHSPGPWGESAKALLRFRGVPFIAVAHTASEANEDLYDWTRLRNAPIAIADSEAPLSNWLDIAMLAERRGTGESLLPAT